jgi:hypothetical protein
VHHLLPLEIPPKSCELTALEALVFPAVRLFVERAAEILEGFELNDTEAPVVADMVFVMIGSLDQPDGIEPKLEMFTKRRPKWTKPLDVPQFPSMPS